MNCSVCGQPIRVIPTDSKLKDLWNKMALSLGKVCMRCAIAYRQAEEEASNMTWEERAKVTEKRMKDRGMSKKEREEAIKAADEKEKGNKK